MSCDDSLALYSCPRDSSCNESFFLSFLDGEDPLLSALEKLMFERQAKVLTFFGRSPKVMCDLYSKTHVSKWNTWQIPSFVGVMFENK